MKKNFATAIMMASTLSFGLSPICFGAPNAPLHSKVEIKTISDNSIFNVEFKIIPDTNMMINHDGPWKLDIKDSAGLDLDPTKPTMNFDLPGFTIKTKTQPTATKGKISYKLIAFVCTKDKSQCFRDVHDTQADWTHKK